MKLVRSIWFVVFAAALSTASAQGDVSFGFRLSSESHPDIDRTNAIDGAVGEEIDFEAEMILSTAGLREGPHEGVQAWSASIWHAGLDITELSVLGTVSATEADGGLRDNGQENGFFRFETLDSRRNEGRRGAVQAAVLSFTQQISLPVNTPNVIGRIHFRAVVQERGRVIFFRYLDGQRGSGQPVQNAVTIKGQTVLPSLSVRDVAVGSGAEPETGDQCHDGIDNDGDAWADELDPGCNSIQTSEDCADGRDNNGNGLVDCRDPLCATSLQCREDCSDGRDNDRDGLVDCDDAACIGRFPCPETENCFDGIDNDEDGDIDCADAQCDGSAACRVPEDCEDGIDNDRDGNIDCEDSECEGNAPCPEPERCADGIDNDEDGDVDCDDDDCLLGACMRFENCLDGIDNDLDGRVDCEDRDCGGVLPCPSLELCDDGIDNDGDGLVDCDDPICSTEFVCSGISGFELAVTSVGDHRRRLADGVERNVLPFAHSPGRRIDVTVLAVPVPAPQEVGIQGWSIAVSHDRSYLDIAEVTTEGTDARLRSDGGFEKSERAWLPHSQGEPGFPPGSSPGDGFVSATVLSFVQQIHLDPTIPQSLARATYRLTEEIPDDGVRLRFDRSLQGSGQPVNTVFTINGQTESPVRTIELELRAGASFLRADSNADGRVDLADAIWIINELVRGGPRTICRLAADTNDDGKIDLSDPIYLARYLFQQGAAIPQPFPDCGTSASSAATCEDGSACR